PVVSAWVMPMGILGVVAIPFGFDAFFWRQMGFGIEWMDTVALWVASLPGAFGRVTSFREQGALALYRDRSSTGFTIEPARPLNSTGPGRRASCTQRARA